MTISELISKIDGIMWGPIMILFLMGTHIFMTIRTKFVQKEVFKGVKESLNTKLTEKGEVSIFGSLMTALSSTIGTGNIIGTATGILGGGPGAVLWMWLGGLFGIATKYAESYVAVKYRHKHSNQQYSGGAMVAYEKLGKPFMAKLFAVLCCLCAFGIGCATQSGAIADSISENFGVDVRIIGIILCTLTAVVIFGGVKSIAKLCSYLVPISSLIYIVGCIAILCINGQYIPEALKLIFVSAFTPRAAIGGFVGSTIIKAASSGVARGLFSNEAGMGSAPQATAAGVAENGVKPAVVGSTGVFWDTIVVCLLSGLVIVTSVISNDAISCFDADGSKITAALLVSKCFGQIPYFGTPLLVFGILTFAYSTILGWAYYGENTARYLYGHRGVFAYRVLWIIVIYIGVVIPESDLWIIADILNAAMCIPNCLLILFLNKQIVKDTDYYLYEGHLEEQDTSME